MRFDNFPKTWQTLRPEQRTDILSVALGRERQASALRNAPSHEAPHRSCPWLFQAKNDLGLCEWCLNQPTDTGPVHHGGSTRCALREMLGLAGRSDALPSVTVFNGRTGMGTCTVWVGHDDTPGCKFSSSSFLISHISSRAVEMMWRM